MVIATGGLTGCSSNGAGDLGKESLVSEKTIEQVLEERTDQWMAIQHYKEIILKFLT